MNKIDLHIHSSYSDDGEFTPYEILQLSKKRGMKTIAITDHNSVQGVVEAVEYSEGLDIDVIPGIEIDCTYNGVNLHLLGYYIDYTLKDFEELNRSIFRKSMDAFPRMITNLKKIGVEVEEEEVLRKAKGKVPSGELIGEVILSKGNSKNNRILKPYLKGGKRSDMPYLNFYWDFFAQGKIAHVPIQYISLEEAIDLIKRSGGVPVIAHPGMNLKGNIEMLKYIIKEGVEGIEIFNNYHTEDQIDHLYKKAKEHGLLITCGSDFHGKNKPGIEIGMHNCVIDGIQLIDAFKKC
ncbi:PHP domain-containing protein [Wukongibacter baidiensis]|uniref:PHP domain-containing protein n=1 Tax=Wukongibacter baidiensis TaxID=1723361 RepID=UPI003D7F3BE8